MSDKDNKIEKLKHCFIKLHDKIQDRVEDLHDHIQNCVEKTKFSKFVSHVSEERYSVESLEKDADEKSSTESSETQKDRSSSIPSVIVDGPSLNDTRQICTDFLTIEKNGVLYRKCLSTSNLKLDNESNLYSSSDSCFSCLSSSDERTSQIRPRAGSLPPAPTLDIPTAINTCSELFEKIGNRFPRLKSKGDRIHRVLIGGGRMSVFYVC